MKKPILRYHGGKWLLASWIIDHFPPHRVYVEPFGGGASVLLTKKPAKLECFNDLDGAVVNLFRVLRDPSAKDRLVEACALTPFSVEEYRDAQVGKKFAWANIADPVERARCLLVSAGMSHGSNGASGKWQCGFRRVLSNSMGRMPIKDWNAMPAVITFTAERFRDVVIEQMPAVELIQKYDASDVLFYVDPPYPLETRGQYANAAYRHEMTTEDHYTLAAILKSCKGMVVLSGYPCDLYDRYLYSTWYRTEREAYAGSAEKRIEVLWLNDAAANNVDGQISFDIRNVCTR